MRLFCLLVTVELDLSNMPSTGCLAEELAMSNNAAEARKVIGFIWVEEGILRSGKEE